MKAADTQLRKQRKGCYRFAIQWGCFGQVRRDYDSPKDWVSEVRRNDGSLIQFAGAHSNRADAVQAILDINPVDYYMEA